MGDTKVGGPRDSATAIEIPSTPPAAHDSARILDASITPSPEQPNLTDHYQATGGVILDFGLPRVVRSGFAIPNVGSSIPENKPPQPKTWKEVQSKLINELLDTFAKPIEIELHGFEFEEAFVPSEQFINAIQQAIVDSKNGIPPTVTFNLVNHPDHPSRVIHITDTHIYDSADPNAAKYFEEATSRVWNDPEVVAHVLNPFFEANPELQTLFTALDVADANNPGSNLGKLLAKVLEKKPQLVPHNQRTQIFSLLDALRTGLLNAFNQAITVGKIPAHFALDGAAFLNPLDQILRQHPRNQAPENSWFSIGGGQMLATLEFPRWLMDQGVLPLDFGLFAVEPYFPLVSEINRTGKNQKQLGDLAINPVGHAQIGLLPASQRDSLLEQNQPQVIWLNLKAGILGKYLQDPQFVSYLRAHPNTVIATPSKSYGDHEPIPYLEMYAALEAIDPQLARNLVVVGGYFGAPDILKHNPISMTLVGENEEALKIVARSMSQNLPDDRLRANSEHLQLKLIPSKEVAVALMAGGANKNLLTYRAAHLLMDELLNQETHDPHTLEEKLDDANQGGIKAQNIQIGEEITARLARKRGVDTTHIESPEGLKEDFRKCLPAIDCATDLIAIAQSAKRLVQLNQMDVFKNLLLEIASGRGGGTRNCKDGLVDSLIRYAYIAQNRDTDGRVDFKNYREFWNQYYPEKLKGQEGRNGIGPLIRYCQANNITLPAEVYETFMLYNPELDVLGAPSEVLLRTLTEVDNATFGISQADLSQIQDALLNVQGSFEVDIFNEETLKERMLTLTSALRNASRNSAYSEIKARLRNLAKRLLDILDLFKKNHIPEASKNAALIVFNAAVNNALATIQTPLLTTTTLLNRIRYTSQELRNVALELSLDLRRQQGRTSLVSALSTIGEHTPAVTPISAAPASVINARKPSNLISANGINLATIAPAHLHPLIPSSALPSASHNKIYGHPSIIDKRSATPWAEARANFQSTRLPNLACAPYQIRVPRGRS